MNYLYLLLVLYLIPLVAYILFYNVYNKYSNIDNKKEISGFEVARSILDNNKLEDMYIVERKGLFTDNFDTKQNVIRLSTSVFHKESLYSLVLSSYYAAKASLFNKKDKTITYKLLIDNFVKVLTSIMYILLIVGLITSSIDTYRIVLYLFIIVLLYKLITIPIEDKIIKYSKKELLNNKYISKTSEDINKLFNILKIYPITEIVTSFSNLYYYFRDEIKK